MVGKTLVNDSQYTKFTNIFPRPIIVLYGIYGPQNYREEYHTELSSDATTFVLTTSRQIAMPLQPKVKAEL